MSKFGLLTPGSWFLLALLFTLVSALPWLGNEVAYGRTMQFDLRVRAAIHEHASPPLTGVMIGVSFVGGPFVILPLTILPFVRLWRAGRKPAAGLLAIAMAGDVFIEQILKWAYHRHRPEPFFNYTLPVSHSFPSGHALTSVVFFGTLAAILTPHLHSTWSKFLVWAAVILVAAAIGFSRVYLGVHYPTDVIAGYDAGLAWLLAVWSLRSATVHEAHPRA